MHTALSRHGDLGSRPAQALPCLRASHAHPPSTQQTQPDTALGQTQHSILHSCKHYVNLTNVSCEDKTPPLCCHILHMPYGSNQMVQTCGCRALRPSPCWSSLASHSGGQLCLLQHGSYAARSSAPDLSSRILDISGHCACSFVCLTHASALTLCSIQTAETPPI